MWRGMFPGPYMTMEQVSLLILCDAPAICRRKSRMDFGSWRRLDWSRLTALTTCVRSWIHVVGGRKDENVRADRAMRPVGGCCSETRSVPGTVSPNRLHANCCVDTGSSSVIC